LTSSDIVPVKWRRLRVLGAHELEQFGVGDELRAQCHREGRLEHAGVVDGLRDLEVAEARAPDALRDAQLLGVRRAREIEPGAVLEPERLDDERVALPAADGIAHEARVRVFRQRAPVEEDLPVAHVLRKDDQERRRLDELHRDRREQIHPRPLRHAVEHGGVVLSHVLGALLD